MFLSPSLHHRKITYFRGIWNSRYMDIILTTVVGVIRKGFCCSPYGHSPEQAALCSEAPDKDTLIHRRRWAILFKPIIGKSVHGK